MAAEADAAPAPAPHLAPFNPTSADAIERALALAAVEDGDVVYDVGCGDGRVLEAVCAAQPAARCVGVELDAALAARARARLEPYADRATVLCCDAMGQLDALVGEATVVFLYLVPDGLRVLAPALARLAASGRRVRVVCNMFSLAKLGWEPTHTHIDKRMRVFLYALPGAAPAPAAAGAVGAGTAASPEA